MDHISLLDNILRRGNVLVTPQPERVTPTTTTTCDDGTARRLADQLVRLEAEQNVQIPRDLEAEFNAATTEDALFTAAKKIKAALVPAKPSARNAAREKRAPW